MDFGADCDDCFWCDSRPNFSNAPDVGKIYGILGDGEKKEVGTQFSKTKVFIYPIRGRPYTPLIYFLR